jgi:hypothetical protein
MADYIIIWLLNSRENVFIIFLFNSKTVSLLKKHRKFTKKQFYEFNTRRLGF